MKRESVVHNLLENMKGEFPYFKKKIMVITASTRPPLDKINIISCSMEPTPEKEKHAVKDWTDTERSHKMGANLSDLCCEKRLERERLPTPEKKKR